MYRNSSAEKLFYVKGLHATLYYLLDDHIGTLVADGDVMHFYYDRYEQHLQFEVLNGQESYKVRTQELDIHNEVIEEAAILTPLRRMAEVSRRFFYTIVTNYSMQSYMGRITKRFFKDDGQNDESCLFIGSYGRRSERGK